MHELSDRPRHHGRVLLSFVFEVTRVRLREHEC